ncbi:universal stress protein [Halorientalis brevis]|uniref:Universal stress protein n=1 Tax=Halorientalis brevis TaxID=1126241 RepID=A0ABD6CHU2_9EURY|nr:universal stress protein [Halorientalis brevis]
MADRVLVPYDGSDQARLALDHAFEQFPDGDVTILHLIEPFPDHSKAAGHPSERLDHVFAERQRLLDEAKAVGEGHGGTIRTTLIYGRPRTEVPHYIETNDFDQIVMGSRGLGGTANLLLGSVSREVIRTTPVPVTVVRTMPTEREGTGTTLTPRSVLVPFDGSASARDALEYALEQFPDAAVTVLFVSATKVDEHQVITSQTELEDVLEQEEDERTRERKRALTAAERIANRYDRDVRTAVEWGNLATKVLEQSRTEGVDHLVIGRPEERRFRDLLQGSVVETIVRRAPVPVTVVP